MSTKRVGVRLVAEGGGQVRAEFEGVGRSGEAALGRIDAQARVTARAVTVAFAAAAAATVAATGAMIRSGLQTVDAQAKLARSLDTTTRSVQVLERAGQLAGVSMGQIEQATLLMTQRLSEAAAGGGPAAAALDRLGLSAEQLLQLPVDERLMAIEAAMERMIPVAERAGLRVAILGRSAQLLERVDTAALRTAASDIDRFNKTLTPEQERQIERTNDAISRLGLAWQGLSRQLAAEAAPSIERVADALAAVTERSGPVGQALDLAARNLDTLARAAGVVTVALGTRYAAAAALAITRTGVLTSGIVALRTATILLGGPVGAVAALLGGAAAAWLLFRDNAGEATDALGATIAAQIALNEALGVFASTGAPNAGREAVAYARNLEQQALAALAAAEAEIALMQAEAARFRNAPPEVRGLLGDAEDRAQARNIEAAMAEVEKLRATLDGARRTANALSITLHDAGDAGVTNLETITFAAEEADRAMRRAGGGARVAADEIEEIGRATELVIEEVNEFQSAFESAFVGIVTGSAKARDAVRALLSDLARLLAQRAFQSLVGGLFGGATQVSGPAMPRGASFAPPIRPFAGGGFTGWGPRSGGLDGQGGFLAMLHPRETVIDHARGQGGALAVGVRVTLSPGLIAEIEDRNAAQSVQIVQQGLQEYDRQALPARMAQITRDPRRRG